MGDALAALALGPDLLHGAGDLLLRLAGFGSVLGDEQVLDPTRLLDHDRDRVVDLVGDAGRELPDRRELAGLDHLVAHQGLFALRLGHLRGHLSGEQVGDHDGGESGYQEDYQRGGFQPRELLEGVGGLLLVAEEPPSLVQRCDREDRFPAENVPALDDRDPVPARRTVDELGVRRAVESRLEARLGLQLTLAIEEEGEAGGPDPDVADQVVEGLEVDRRLHEVALVALRPGGGDDEVRAAAQAGEDIRDVVLSEPRLLEPLGGRVVGHRQVEGSGVRDLHAVPGHQAEVDEGAVVLLAEHVEELTEQDRVLELRALVLTGDDPDVGEPVLDEGVDGFGVALHELADVVADLVLVSGPELLQIDGAGDHHRRHGDHRQGSHHRRQSEPTGQRDRGVFRDQHGSRCLRRGKARP